MNYSFDDNFQTFQSNSDRHISLSFADFFDWPHFSSYWAARNLSTVLLDELEAMRSPILDRIQTVNRPWGVRDDEGVKQLFRQASFDFPLKKNTTFRFDDKKAVALYNYFQSGNDPENPLMQLLVQVEESLRPNSLIRNLVALLQSQIPDNYYAMHLRVEGDVTGGSFEDFSKLVEQSIAAMKESECYLSSFNAQTNLFETPLYIASGSLNPDGEIVSEIDEEKRKYILTRLKEVGVKNIFYRTQLVASLPIESVVGSQFRRMKGLFLEQLAWIDFNIVRDGACFIPSYGRESSFTYMILRLKEIKNKIFSTEIRPPHSELQYWGV